MKIYNTHKTVFSIQNNAKQFLNGLTSNELDAPHNAFLNIHGRIIVVFDLFRIGEDQFLIAINPDYEAALLEHIERFVALSGVKVEKMDYQVYYDLDGDVSVSEEGWAIGQRHGKLIITNQSLEDNVSEEDFTEFRIKSGIPWHGIDFKDELVLNVSLTDYVSFTKGCFLGQEPVSKVYNRSKPTWKLVVRHEDDCSAEEKAKMTSIVNEPASGKKIGFVFVKNS